MSPRSNLCALALLKTGLNSDVKKMGTMVALSTFSSWLKSKPKVLLQAVFKDHLYTCGFIDYSAFDFLICV